MHIVTVSSKFRLLHSNDLLSTLAMHNRLDNLVSRGRKFRCFKGWYDLSLLLLIGKLTHALFVLFINWVGPDLLLNYLRRPQIISVWCLNVVRSQEKARREFTYCDRRTNRSCIEKWEVGFPPSCHALRPHFIRTVTIVTNMSLLPDT